MMMNFRFIQGERQSFQTVINLKQSSLFLKHLLATYHIAFLHLHYIHSRRQIGDIHRFGIVVYVFNQLSIDRIYPSLIYKGMSCINNDYIIS